MKARMQKGFTTRENRRYRGTFGVDSVIWDLSYNKYQLNIVLQDGSRQNISSYKSGDNAAEDGVALSGYLKVPYWEDRYSK